MSPGEIDSFFGDIEEILRLHRDLLRNLETALFKGDLVSHMGKLILDKLPLLRMRLVFVGRYDRFGDEIDAISKARPKLKKLLAQIEAESRYPLQILMEIASLRLWQYSKVCLNLWQKVTPEFDHPGSLFQAHKEIEELISILTHEANGRRFRTILLRVQREVFADSVDIFHPKRMVLKTSGIKCKFIKTGRQLTRKVILLLFNDMIIFASKKQTAKKVLLLHTCHIGRIEASSFEIQGERGVYYVICSSKEARDEWVTSISHAIEEAKRRFAYSVQEEQFERMICKLEPMHLFYPPPSIEARIPSISFQKYANQSVQKSPVERSPDTRFIRPMDDFVTTLPQEKCLPEKADEKSHINVESLNDSMSANRSLNNSNTLDGMSGSVARRSPSAMRDLFNDIESINYKLNRSRKFPQKKEKSPMWAALDTSISSIRSFIVQDEEEESEDWHE